MALHEIPMIGLQRTRYVERLVLEALALHSGSSPVDASSIIRIGKSWQGEKGAMRCLFISEASKSILLDEGFVKAVKKKLEVAALPATVSESRFRRGRLGGGSTVELHCYLLRNDDRKGDSIGWW